MTHGLQPLLQEAAIRVFWPEQFPEVYVCRAPEAPDKLLPLLLPIPFVPFHSSLCSLLSPSQST